MQISRPTAAIAGLACILAASGPLTADDKTILIELSARSGGLLNAVSATGSVAVGSLVEGGAFYWMPTTGAIAAGGQFAIDVSRDGRTIVGNASDSQRRQQAGIWIRAAEWRLLGSFSGAAPCDASLSNAAGVSGDGRVVVGHANNGCSFAHAFRWEESTGMVDLGTLVANRNTAARGVSGNGRVVVGRQTRTDGTEQGTRWLDNRQELIPVQAGNIAGYVGEARGTNHDGTIVVGESCYASGLDQSAWVWTEGGGTQCLPPPALRFVPGPGAGPPVIGEANATSDDGRIIGGGHRIGTQDSEAVIWIDREPVYLKDFLRANGVPNAFEGWPRTGAIEGVSPDGRILVGWGAAPAGFRGYIVILGSQQVMP